MSKTSQSYQRSSDYNVSDQEARQRYQDWKVAEEQKFAEAQVKFTPESIPEMADRLFNFTTIDEKYLESHKAENKDTIKIIIIAAYPISILMCMVFMMSDRIPYEPFLSLILAVLVPGIFYGTIVAIATISCYYLYCRYLDMRLDEHYTKLALENYNSVHSSRGFEAFIFGKTIKFQGYYHYSDEEPKFIWTELNLLHWRKLLSRNCERPLIVENSYPYYARLEKRRLSKFDRLLRKRLICLADLWYLGLKDYSDLRVAQSDHHEAIEARRELEILHQGALLSGNFVDADRLWSQLQTSCAVEAEKYKLVCLQGQKVNNFLGPYNDLIAEIETIAERIAALKIKRQTIKALDGLSWRQKDLCRLLDIEDSKFELRQS